MSDHTVPIALLSQTGESGRHLREALAGVGTPIVYEAHAAELDRDALEKSGARVVVVNLDSEVDAHLDEVYSLLGDDRYNVIFNEAQVSSQLSGWERARWARHLAAKIFGTSDSDPPRPEGAEAVPQRITVPNEAAISAGESQREIAVTEVIDAEAIAHDSATNDTDVDDFSDISALLAETDAWREESTDAQGSTTDATSRVGLETVQMPVLDFSEFDVPETLDAPAIATVADEQARGDYAIAEEALSFESLPGDQDDVLGFGDLDGFADGGDDIDEAFEPSPAVEAEMPLLAEELAGYSEASEAAATGASLSDLELLALDWADAPEPPKVEADQLQQEEVTTPAVVGSAFDWSLEEVEDGANSAPSTESIPVKPREFGIEKISASEYLAPESAPESNDTMDAEFSLELIPIEEAMSPQVAATQGSMQGPRESWLDPSATSNPVVRNVWVLGASIGGPEAVREFLSEIPKDFPALFLLAQHMGAEFMEIMAQQLARSTSLTVRTPAHGERVAHGEIIVVPTTHRLRVDSAGVVVLEAITGNSLVHSPSIDQVLRDVADRFGAKAGVIVFSGMAEDAAEGSRYLAELGGKVYVQDPQTCVISSMVDGVIETGVVNFTGSPKALAGKVLGDIKPVARN